MATNIDPKVIATIVNVLVYRTDGASLHEIGAAFGNAPDQLKSSLDELVAERILRLDITPKGKRYYATTAAMVYVKRSAPTEPNATQRAPETPTAGATEGQRVGAAENQNVGGPDVQQTGGSNERSESDVPDAGNEGVNERDDAPESTVSDLLQLITPVVDAVTESASGGRTKTQSSEASRTAVLRALADAIPKVLKTLFPDGLPAKWKPLIGLTAGTLVIAGLVLTEWRPGTAASLSLGLSVLVFGFFGARFLRPQTASDDAQKSRSGCSEVIQTACGTTPEIRIENGAPGIPEPRASAPENHAGTAVLDAQSAASASPPTPPPDRSVTSDSDAQKELVNAPINDAPIRSSGAQKHLPTQREDRSIHASSGADATYVQLSRRTLYLISLGGVAAIISIGVFAWHLSRNRPTPNHAETQRVDATVSRTPSTATPATVGGALRPDSTPVGGASRPESPRNETGMTNTQAVAVSAESPPPTATQITPGSRPGMTEIPHPEAPVSSTPSPATTAPAGGALRPDSPHLETGSPQPQNVAVSAQSASQTATPIPAETRLGMAEIPHADATTSTTPLPAATAPVGGVSRADSATAKTPIDRPTQAPTPTAPATPNYPPNEPGAFALIGDKWVPLPRNNGHGIQNVQQKLTGLLGGLNRFEDAVVGKSAAPSKTPVGEVRFDGPESVPVAATDDIVLAYVGPLTSFTPEQLARYPELKTYPAIELAPTVTRSDGVRTAPLYPIAASFLGFGPTRIMTATVERRAIPPFDGVAVHAAMFLRCTAPLPPGRYALLCGSNTYELAVE